MCVSVIPHTMDWRRHRNINTLLLFSHYVMSNSLQPHGQGPLYSTVSWSLLKFMSIESVMISNNLFLWHPFFLFPSIFPSIRVFYNELALCISWPKNWCFSISNSPSNEYSGLISFRIHWFDLVAVQGTLKSLLQHHNSKASILQFCLLYGPTFTSVHD